MEKPRNEPATLGLQGIALIRYTKAVAFPELLFCGFPVYKPFPLGWFMIFVLVVGREHPKAHRKWFMEKPGIKPVTPSIGLSPTPQWLLFWCFFFVAFRGINKFCWVGLR